MHDGWRIFAANLQQGTIEVEMDLSLAENVAADPARSPSAIYAGPQASFASVHRAHPASPERAKARRSDASVGDDLSPGADLLQGPN
jgi:hypothetical protein